MMDRAFVMSWFMRWCSVVAVMFAAAVVQGSGFNPLTFALGYGTGAAMTWLVRR